MTSNRMRKLVTLNARLEKKASVMLVMLVYSCGLKLFVQSELASRTRRSNGLSFNPAFGI